MSAVSDSSAVRGVVTERYREEFENIVQQISLYQGFVLVPIECPGIIAADALVRFLRDRGWSVRFLAPEGAEWESLAEALMSGTAPPTRERSAVVVAGEGSRVPTLAYGLAVLNQSRDRLSRRLDCPLLWCGPQEFQIASWEGMPDLWSIRTLTIRLKAVSSRVDLPVEVARRWLWFGGARDSLPQRPQLRKSIDEARARGDARAAVVSALPLCQALSLEGQLEEAATIASEWMTAPSPDGFLSGDPHRLGLVLTKVQILLRDWGAAETTREQVARRFRRSLDTLDVAVDLVLLKGLLLVEREAFDEAETNFHEAAQRERRLEDLRVAASIQLERAASFARQGYPALSVEIAGNIEAGELDEGCRAAISFFLGRLYRDMGETNRARQSYRSALRRFTRVDSSADVAIVEHELLSMEEVSDALGLESLPAPRAPSSSDYTRNLARLLASLYSSTDAVERLAADAGLVLPVPEAKGTVYSLWRDLLQRAEREDRLTSLLDIVRQEYPHQAARLRDAMP